MNEIEEFNKALAEFAEAQFSILRALSKALDMAGSTAEVMTTIQGIKNNLADFDKNLDEYARSRNNPGAKHYD